MISDSLLEFGNKINSIMPVFLREMVKRQINELFKGKITLPQFLILNFLYTENESSMSKIANFMSVTTAAMTGIVDRLVRDSYVIRTYNPKDRRIIMIRLTSKGKALVDKINQQRRNMIIDIFGRLSEEERKQYLGILNKVCNILIEDAKRRKK